MFSKILTHIPFHSLRDSRKGETEASKRGPQGPLRSTAKFIFAPVIGLIYFLILPVAAVAAFFAVVFQALYHLAVIGLPLGTRPRPAGTHSR
ncbi:MAG: hypothetical protein COZ95_09090 [Nitrospirae bacterium CG_4_8_14_3_um_filter_50_41]|nr:MAG: hypothetical protein COZ95_09090 [Nitrospirae bacterium CG_4_8_14_3_um_filter_50_41]